MPTATPQRQQPELSSTAPAAPVRRGGLRLAWALLGGCIYRSFVDAAVLGFGLGLVCAFALSAASSDGAGPLLAALPAAGQTGALLGAQLGLLASLLQVLVLVPAGLLLLAPAERWSDRHYLLGPLGAALNLGLYLLLGGALTERALPLLQSHPALWSLLNPVPALLTALLAVALPPLAALHGWRIGGALARQHALARGVALPGSADYAQLALSDPDFRRQVRAAGAVRGARALAAASLGALPRWQAQLVRRIDLRPGMRVCDLNPGDGSLWPHIMSRIEPGGLLDAVEPSPVACRAAEPRLRALAPAQIALHCAEPAHTDLPGGVYDAVFCAFGLRTLAVEEQAALLDEIQRLLSPNGIFGIVELSAPRQARRRRLLLSYLRHGLPPLALLLGARPAAYAPQADYIARFGQGDHLAAQLRARGFHIHRFHLSGGRAALLVGMKERPPDR